MKNRMSVNLDVGEKVCSKPVDPKLIAINLGEITGASWSEIAELDRKTMEAAALAPTIAISNDTK